MDTSVENITSAANRKIIEIWRSHISSNSWPEPLLRLWPLQYHPMEPGKLLFVGLNPSHDQRHDNLYSINIEPGAEPLSKQQGAVVLRRDKESMGLHGGKLHKYFSLFSQFEPEWNHIDLFAIRHTKQDDVVSALRLNEDAEFSSSFVREQLELAFDLMIALRPPVVVVVNAFGSTIVKRHLLRQEPSFAMDDETGFYWATLNGRRVPFFFSGMLTGQRAIDTHSRERLIWHVRRALATQAKT